MPRRLGASQWGWGGFGPLPRRDVRARRTRWRRRLLTGHSMARVVAAQAKWARAPVRESWQEMPGPAIFASASHQRRRRLPGGHGPLAILAMLMRGIRCQARHRSLPRFAGGWTG